MNKKIMINDEYSIEQVHDKLLILLSEFDRICRKNKIRYILDSGTLIGAVRHNGFIPWDDDADVAMLRKDYKKFIKACKRDLNHDLFTLDTIHTSKNSILNFGKLKLNNTIWVERGNENINIHQGVYIDIFPLDNAFNWTWYLQFKFANFWKEVRWVKMGRSCEYHRIAHKIFGKILPLKLINFNAELTMRMFNIFPSKKTSKISSPKRGRPPHSKKFYTDIIEHPFRNKLFFIPKDYDEMLTILYGDWRKLPPKEEQKPEHNIIKIKL